MLLVYIHSAASPVYAAIAAPVLAGSLLLAK